MLRSPEEKRYLKLSGSLEEVIECDFLSLCFVKHKEQEFQKQSLYFIIIKTL